jgi:hypothetical protein
MLEPNYSLGELEGQLEHVINTNLCTSGTNMSLGAPSGILAREVAGANFREVLGK